MVKLQMLFAVDTEKPIFLCWPREDEHMCLDYLSTDSSVQHIQKSHMPVFHSANGRCHEQEEGNKDKIMTIQESAYSNKDFF